MAFLTRPDFPTEFPVVVEMDREEWTINIRNATTGEAVICRFVEYSGGSHEPARVEFETVSDEDGLQVRSVWEVCEKSNGETWARLVQREVSLRPF